MKKTHCPDCKSKKKHKCLCHQMAKLAKLNKNKGMYLVFPLNDFKLIKKFIGNGFEYADKAFKNGYMGEIIE